MHISDFIFSFAVQKNNSNNKTFDIMKIVYNYSDSVITEDFMQKVADFEGFSSIPYICPAGKYTVGFGHTKGVTSTTRVNVEVASELLYSDLKFFHVQLRSLFELFDSFDNDFQRALVDFCFNIGFTRFCRSSIALLLASFSLSSDIRPLYGNVCDILAKYIYSNKKVLRGLVKRRQWEISLIQGCLLER